MPTGYTSILDEKPDTTFEQFALRCARAFGALVHMRDDSMDAVLPEQIEPSPYYLKSLEDSVAEVSRLEAMTEQERKEYGASAIAKNNERHEEAKAEFERTNAAYCRMRDEVRNWEAPEPLVSMKRFMLDQLNTGKPSDYSKPDERQPLEAWAKDLESAKTSCKYRREAWEEEKERADSRNAWLQTLRSSLNLEVSSNG